LGVVVMILVLFGIGYAIVWQGAGTELRRSLGPGFVISYVVILAAAVVSPNAVIYFVFLLLAPVIMVRDRVDVVCRYVMFAVLMPQVAWQLGAGSHNLVRLDSFDVLAVSSLVMAGRMTRPRAAILKGLGPEDLLVGVLFLVFWIGTERLMSPTVALRGMIQQGMSMPLAYYVFRKHIRTADELQRVLACFAVSCVILSVMALFESRHAWALFDGIRRHLSPTAGAASVMQRGGGLRASVTTGTPLMLACWLMLGMFAAISSRSLLRSRRWFQAWLAIIFLGFVATKSRGDLPLVGIGLVILAFLNGRKAIAWGMAIVGGVAGAAILLVKPDATFGGQDLASDYRVLLLHRGMEEAWKHPWGGASLSDVMDRLVDITQGQQIIDFVNAYLEVFLVAGIIGLGPLVACLAMIILRLLRSTKQLGDVQFDRVRAFALIAIVMYACVFAINSYAGLMVFLLMFLLGGTRVVTLERARRVAVMRRPAGPVPPAELPAGAATA
jgi:hypothetical protein